MGRKKIGVIVAGVLLPLLGVVAAVTMRSDSSSRRPETVASTASVVTTISTDAASTAPASATTPSSVPRTAQDIQQFIAGLTAQIQASANATNTGAPLTPEQVEAQVRAQLKLLGINF